MAKLKAATRGKPDGPLLVVLHGRAEDEQRSIRISERFDPEGDFHTLALRAPHAVPGGYSWFPTWGERSTKATIGQIRKAVRTAAEQLGLRVEHACVIGFSEGAAAALGLAYHEADPLLVRSIVSFGGFQPRDLTFRAGPPLPPALLVRGTDDHTITAAESTHLAETLTALGVPVTRREFDGAHHIPSQELHAARAWLEGLS